MWLTFHRAPSVPALELFARQQVDAGLKPGCYRRYSGTVYVLLFIGGCLLVSLGSFFGVLALLLIVILPAVAVLGGGMICGVMMAGRVAGQVIHMNTQNRADVIAVTPLGWGGVLWLNAFLAYRGSTLISQVHGIAEGMAIAGGLSGLAFIGVSVLSGGVLTSLIFWGVLVVSCVIYLELMFSTLAGTLMGIGLTVDIRDRVSGQMLAVVAFLSFQFISYVVIYVLSFLIIPAVFITPTFIILVQFTAYCLIRWGGVLCLRAWAIRRYQLDPAEFYHGIGLLA